MSTSGFEYGVQSDYGFYGGNMPSGGIDPMGGHGNTFADGGLGNKSAEKKGSKERQSLIPVTIKQLLSAINPDGIFKVDDAELFTVKIVGIIESAEIQATNKTFQISDTTGVMECKKWIEKDSKEDKKSEHCIANTLVRVSGVLREYEGRRHVLVYDMTPITDWNEMTHHFLESILVHLQHTRGPIAGSVKMEMSSFASPGMAGNMGARQGVAVVGGGEQQIEEALLDLFKSDESEGINCETAHNMLCRNPRFASYSIMDVRRIVTSMSNQGRLYSTIDDEHYKSTE